MTKEQGFWQWFLANEARHHTFDPRDVSGREPLFNELSKRLEAVHADLTFEFSPVFDDGTRELVISADGIKAAFPAVEALCEAAPSIPRWRIVKFRPRRTPILPIRIPGLEIDPKTVHYTLFRDGIKIGIMLFHQGYKADLENAYATAMYLLLDEALGEYDVETKVGFIEIRNTDAQYFNPDQVLPDLPSDFDAAFARLPVGDPN